MAKSTPGPQWQKAVVALSTTAVCFAVVTALYWAQIVFIPLAMAAFLAFLLTPTVRRLERIGVGRVPAVVIVVASSALILGELGWLVTRQTASLADELPDYSANIQQKIQSLREMSGGWDRFQKLLEDVAGAWQEPAPPAEDGKGHDLIVIQRESPPWLARLPGLVGYLVEVGVGMALALVLVIFMLVKREDIRNRFLRLMGRSHVAFTTKAVDEAGQRVSRYLQTQAAINVAYGAAFAVGLGIIGVKYALLWGFFAAVLRYVPYVGAWVAIFFPLTLSVAMFESWGQPLAVLTCFLALEVISYNVLEPMLFKRSLGVSELAQLLAAAFWGFLWGPVGLVLSAPLTVCLLVLGKYVPQLEFLDIVLGDEPALDTPESYYQRLLAWDEDDAALLVRSEAQRLSHEELFDSLLIPALNYTKRDRIRDEITEEDEKYILRATREIIEDLHEEPQGAAGASEQGNGEPSLPRVLLLGCPSFDDADSLALEMLNHLLSRDRWDVQISSADMLTAEVVAKADEQSVSVICIASLPPGGLAHARYLCKRLRARVPAAKIIVGRWGHEGILDSTRDDFLRVGADEVTATLAATRVILNAWLPVVEQRELRMSSAVAEAAESTTEDRVAV